MTTPPPPTSPLAAFAHACGRRFGAAVRIDELEAEDDLRSCVLADCVSLTPEIHLKWDALEWSKGALSYRPVDQLLDFADAHGCEVRGHALLWPRSTPPWARSEIEDSRRWSTVGDHIARTLGRYAGRIQRWDVVNEPIDTVEGQDGLRSALFLQAYGPGYIRAALQEARTHASHAILMINDYGFDYANPVDEARRRRFMRLLEDLKSSGAPLDGVGLQAHLDLSKGPLPQSTLARFLDDIAALGLEIDVTELDVLEADRSVSLAQRDLRVADETRRYLDVALANPAVRSVTTWGLSDRHSWLSPTEGLTSESQRNRGLPYDRSLHKKPMYQMLVEAFRLAAPIPRAT